MLDTLFVDAPSSGALILPVAHSCVLGLEGHSINDQMHGMLSWVMRHRNFSGAMGETIVVPTLPDSPCSDIILTGIGNPKKADLLTFENAAGNAVEAFTSNNLTATNVHVMAPRHQGLAISGDEATVHMALGAQLRWYHYDMQKSQPPQRSLRTLSIVGGNQDVRQAWARQSHVVAGVHWARDLINAPSNILTPPVLAAECLKLQDFGVEVAVLGPKKLEKEGMNGLLAVASGSQYPAQFVVMKYTGDPDAEDQRPLALVGKGVTFDSGGICIKTPFLMNEMNDDMAGAAAVMGAMRAFAGQKARVNVVAVLPIAENMPGPTAARPGDIIKMRSGKTVEFINTDSEGRIIVADAISYVQDHYRPSQTITMVTIGDVSSALGAGYAGLCSNDNPLSSRIIAAGQKTGECVWGVPWDQDFHDRAGDSNADYRSGAKGWGGAAGYTPQFIMQAGGNGTPLATVDMAALNRAAKSYPTVPMGPRGFGVRLLHAVALGS